jgi:hypothetical protein
MLECGGCPYTEKHEHLCYTTARNRRIPRSHPARDTSIAESSVTALANTISGLCWLTF